MDNPFQNQEWNLINTQGSNEVPKVADFLGVSKSENQSDLVAFNDIQANDSVSDYLFPNNSIVPHGQYQHCDCGSSPKKDFGYIRTKNIYLSRRIDGQEGMKLIFGITVAEGRDNRGRAAKVGMTKKRKQLGLMTWLHLSTGELLLQPIFQ
ncbi:AP2-like ethylene-responsive transcription factor PLT2 [Prunus yedoensis var. nudiflora]|uniref:AP2-like ethylene-responsive transcription factor PLT2 n=1 Tax=Prunus yedoensis var. nudiflora TaxID=2094558 RepID=A0A314YSV9_PRUYE|nr:AP2-like ethylene-responsive transcription factor PLT2 [Prunus yedoensis var. nudiflora]